MKRSRTAIKPKDARSTRKLVAKSVTSGAVNERLNRLRFAKSFLLCDFNFDKGKELNLKKLQLLYRSRIRL